MQPHELVVALDQGGQSTRAIVFDAGGAVVAYSRRAVEETRPRPGRVEQDPDELVASLRTTLDDVAHELAERAADVIAVGLATQRSSVVCWDSDGAALSPVLSWQDVRAELPAGLDPDDIHSRTGLFPSPHYGAAKIRWCLDHLAPVRAAERAGRLTCGPLASFLAARLTAGARGTADPANAGRTLLWNLARQDWDEALLECFGVPRAVLPPCAPTVGDHGRVRFGARSIPLRALNGDQSAALFAHGPPRPDAAHVNAGTGAFVQRRIDGDARVDDFPRNPVSVVCREGSRSVTVVEGTVNGAASALRWAEEELGVSDIEARLPAWLEAERDPPLFLNAVSGLGSPFWVSDLPSGFVGAGSAAARSVAVVESVVFLLQANLEQLAAPARLRPLERLVLTGGLARLEGFCTRLAGVTGLAVHRPAEVEATARGIAFLAAGGPDAFHRVGAERVFEPRQAPTGLVERYGRWRAELERALA